MDSSGVNRGDTVTCSVTEITSGGIEVSFGDGDAMKSFIRKSDLSRDRAEQRPERFAVGDKVDARITNIDKSTRRVSLSIKALEISEEREAVEQYGSSDAGASLGDILGVVATTLHGPPPMPPPRAGHRLGVRSRHVRACAMHRLPPAFRCGPRPDGLR